MGVFTDWGANDEFEDLDAAKKAALVVVASTASARKWSDYYKGTVESFVETAYKASDGWITDDVEGFYASVAAAMDGLTSAWTTAKTPIPDGWTKLRDYFASAGQSTATTTAAKEEGSVATVVGGTIAKTGEDLATAANPLKSVVPWLVLGGVVVAYKIWKG